MVLKSRITLKSERFDCGQPWSGQNLGICVLHKRRTVGAGGDIIATAEAGLIGY